MTRTVLAVAALALLALLGVSAVWLVYDLAAIYADPTGSELSVLGALGGPILIAVVMLVAVAATAVALAKGRVRSFVTVAAAVMLGVSLVGIVVGNHYGVVDKRADTARPPHCGIENAALREEFERIDHPGFFGGGSGSRNDCSYLLTTGHVPNALEEYHRVLSSRGYTVTRDADGVTAETEGFRFAARIEDARHGDDYLTVSLTDLG